MVLKISWYSRPKNNKYGVSQKSIVSSCPLKEQIWSVAAPLAQNLEIEECLQPNEHLSLNIYTIYNIIYIYTYIYIILYIYIIYIHNIYMYIYMYILYMSLKIKHFLNIITEN